MNRIIYPGSQEVTIGYTNNGNITFVKNEASNVYYYTYDASGNVLTKSMPGNRTWSYVYNYSNVNSFGKPVNIRILPLSGNTGDVPMSIAEKKNAEHAKRENAVKEATDSHPLVKAALGIFGGEVVAYKQ